MTAAQAEMCRLSLTTSRLGLPSAVGSPKAAPAAAAPWRPSPPPAFSAEQASCDSSDCSYCQGLSQLRRSGEPGCWLRRKRSRTDLAGMAQQVEEGGGSSGGPSEGSDGGAEAGPSSKQPRVACMWDHALADPELTDVALSCQAEPSTRGIANGVAFAYRPWSWDASWAARALPPSARLRQLAAFQRPQPAKHRRQTADIVAAVEFEEHGWLLATAGVAKQVRVYSLSSYLENPQHPRWQQPIRVHRMASKLTSLAWNPDQPGVVTVGDYDGEITQIDLESGHMVVEADGHAGRRVWSVNHSRLRPHLCASASDDGTVRLWGGPCLGSGAPALVVAPPSGAPLTSVQLSPWDEHGLAVASSDHNVYVYDLRRAASPLWTLAGHDRAASYVRYLSRGRLVTAAVDATLAAWDLPGLHQEALQPLVAPAPPAPAAGGVVGPWRRFRGHRNGKNFVGLAVRPEGQLLACGSEGPEAYAYQLSWDSPLACGALSPGTPPPAASAGGGSRDAPAAPFCSAVCWQPAVAAGPGGTPLLAAAMSDGELRVLGLQAQR